MIHACVLPKQSHDDAATGIVSLVGNVSKKIFLFNGGSYYCSSDADCVKNPMQQLSKLQLSNAGAWLRVERRHGWSGGWRGVKRVVGGGKGLGGSLPFKLYKLFFNKGETDGSERH